MNSFKMFRVGNDERPASQEDIDFVKHKIGKLSINTPFMVTHHCVDCLTIINNDEKFYIFRVGNNERPASNEDLEIMEKEIHKFQNEFNFHFKFVVMYHAIDEVWVN